MALHAAPYPPASNAAAAASAGASSCGCSIPCSGNVEAGTLCLLESLQRRGALQALSSSQGPPASAQAEGHFSDRGKGVMPPSGGPRRGRPVVLGPRRAGAPTSSPVHGSAGQHSLVEAPLATGGSAPSLQSGVENGCSTSKVNLEIAEVALLVEGGEELATTQQEALARYVRLMGLSASTSFHSDLLYAGERARQWGPSCAPGEDQGPPLGGSEAGRRAAVVDIIMSYAADLQRCFGAASGDVARVSIQLAVSILDRSRLIERVRKDPDAVRCCAAFCLVMALQHEAPNSMSLETKLKKLLLLEKLVPQTFGVPFGELQRQVLDSLGCRVSVPLPVDFASYLVYDAAAFGGAPGTPGGPPASATELVCYLLDCFSLTPEAAITPASLAAAAAVELARRIARAEGGHGQSPAVPSCGTAFLQEIAGCSRQQLRATLRTIHSFLTSKASKYPGLKRLHEKGWAAVDWQLPQR